MNCTDSIEIYKTRYASWYWWPALMEVNRIPKGQKHSDVELFLTAKKNTELEALKKALRYDLKNLNDIGKKITNET